MECTLRLIEADATDTEASILNVLELTNDADPRQVSLKGVDRVDLQFPKFSDGRAFSQAFVLRRRLRFAGEIRATGDVLVDMLPLLARTGFDAVRLRPDQRVEAAERALGFFAGHYQGDVQQPLPAFSRDLDSELAEADARRRRDADAFAGQGI